MLPSYIHGLTSGPTDTACSHTTTFIGGELEDGLRSTDAAGQGRVLYAAGRVSALSLIGVVHTMA